MGIDVPVCPPGMGEGDGFNDKTEMVVLKIVS